MSLTARLALPFTALLAVLLVCGYNPGAVVRQRTEEILRDNAALDRRLSARAAQLVRARWLVDGNSWYAKMENPAAMVRLDSPTVGVKPLHPGGLFYTGWAGDVTISSGVWQSRPATRPRAVFSVRYRVIFRDLKTPEIEIAEGPGVSRASATDVLNFNATD